MYFRFSLEAGLISFPTYTVGWVVGKLESNAKLNSKLRLKLKLKLELSLAIHLKSKRSESQYCFANISALKAQIFMKFHMVANYYLVN